MFCHLAVLIYLCGEVRKKCCNCVCPFERKGNWISVNTFLYFNSKVCNRLPKRCTLENKSQKWKEIIIKPFIFIRNLPCLFTAEHCRSALRQRCYSSKEMIGLSSQGSGMYRLGCKCVAALLTPTEAR